MPPVVVGPGRNVSVLVKLRKDTPRGKALVQLASVYANAPKSEIEAYAIRWYEKNTDRPYVSELGLDMFVNADPTSRIMQLQKVVLALNTCEKPIIYTGDYQMVKCLLASVIPALWHYVLSTNKIEHYGLDRDTLRDGVTDMFTFINTQFPELTWEAPNE